MRCILNNLEFKVGDIVGHVLYNGEFVVEASGHYEQPLLVRFADDKVDTFYKDGRSLHRHDKSSLVLIRRPKKLKEVTVELYANVYSHDKNGIDIVNFYKTQAEMNMHAGFKSLNPTNKLVKITYLVEVDDE